MIYIYYHQDMDRKVSGATMVNLLYHYFKIQKEDIVLYSIPDYTKILDIPEMDNDTYLIFVDYSFTNEYNLKLLEDAYKKYPKNVLWIDHHISSIKNYEKYPFLKDIYGIRSTDYCGACLSLYYANKMIMESIEHNNFQSKITGFGESICKLNLDKDVMVDLLKRHPFYEYVDSWDTWKHTKENDYQFMLNFSSLELINTVDSFLDMIDYINREYITYMITNGAIIEQYLKNTNKEFMESMSFSCKINGYSVICYNGRGNSKTFGDLIDKYDMCCMFYFNGTKYIYSLYSRDDGPETLHISTKMKGGGHPHASGFSTDYLILSKDIDLHI